MTIGRLLRTVRHLKLQQIAWRALHEARLAAYERIGAWPSRYWMPDPHARFVGAAIEAAPFAELRPLAETWRRGVVSYLASEGARDDWCAQDRPKLWRYERQYHRELTALAAMSVVEPHGPWLAEARAMIASWLAASPPAAGDAWEPYPVARRILSWSLAGVLCPTLGSELVSSLAMQLRFLSSHYERHLLGNHLLCDACAVVAASAVLESDGAEARGRQAMALLERELRRQSLPDGGYAERTIQYHAIVLFDLIVALGLWQRRGRPVPSSPLAVARRMATLLGRVRRTDGSLPWLNDAAPDATPSPSFLFSVAAALGLADIVADVEPATSDLVLPDTGWQLVREGEDELLFDVGPIGPAEQPGHGHSDALSFELRFCGTPVVVDTGVSEYAVGERRAFERSASAHACIAVDGEGPDELWGAFRVGARGQVQSAPLERIGDVRRLRGSVTAPRGWRHERTLVYWPRRVLVVRDLLTGAGAERGAAHVPLSPEWTLVDHRLVAADRHLQWTVLEGALRAIEPGWVSRGFGRRRERSTLVVAMSERGDAIYAIGQPECSIAVDDDRLRLHADGETREIGLR